MTKLFKSTTAVASSNFELLEAKLWDEADKIYWIVARKA